MLRATQVLLCQENTSATTTAIAYVIVLHLHSKCSRCLHLRNNIAENASDVLIQPLAWYMALCTLLLLS
jgi:hypothetical protein